MVDLKKAKLLDFVFFFTSSCFFLLSLVVTFYAIGTDQTEFSYYAKKKPALNLVIFVLTLLLLALVEGILIALVELKRIDPDTYKDKYPRAHKLGEVVLRGDNVERFLMGRQFIVTLLSFVAAKLSTVQLDPERKFVLFPMNKWIEKGLLETSFLACYMVVVLAQLVPEIIATKYPLQFLNCVVMKPTYYFCVFIEVIGVTHCCWLIVCFFESALCLKQGSQRERAREGEGGGETDDGELGASTRSIPDLASLHFSYSNSYASARGDTRENTPFLP